MHFSRILPLCCIIAIYSCKNDTTKNVPVQSSTPEVPENVATLTSEDNVQTAKMSEALFDIKKGHESLLKNISTIKERLNNLSTGTIQKNRTEIESIQETISALSDKIPKILTSISSLEVSAQVTSPSVMFEKIKSEQGSLAEYTTMLSEAEKKLENLK